MLHNRIIRSFRLPICILYRFLLSPLFGVRSPCLCVPPRFREGFTNELIQLLVSFFLVFACLFDLACSGMSFCVPADASVDAAL